MQYTNLIWRDGQPYSEMFDDIYYSSDDSESISGEHEFNHVFFKNNGLPERWSGEHDFIIAELGFGSGLNCILTIREWLKHTADDVQNKCLHYIAFEKYPLSPEAIKELVSRYPELNKYCDELLDVYPPAVEGSHRRHLFDNRVVIHYKFMDAYEALKNESYNVDAWYLDGFSPAKNVDMWSQVLFKKIAQNSHRKTTCSTYTAAGFVKRNLQNAGFKVDKVDGYGKKREMLVAKLDDYKQEPVKFSDQPWFIQPVKPDYPVKQATIIGAGIAGLCVAYSLVKRGWSVTVIDKHGDVAKETSSNPAAIVYPRLAVNDDIDTTFNTEAFCYAVYILSMLQNKHREKFWSADGLLQLFDKKKISKIINKFQFNKDFISLSEFCNDKALMKTIMKNTQQACVEYKAAGVVLPQVLCDVLVKECGERLNIVHADINNIRYDNKRWLCFTEDDSVYETEVLVIASGVQLNDFGLEINFPVKKVRGQVVVLKNKSESRDITQAVNAGVYLTPLTNGKHYLGATYSRNSHSIEVDDKDTDTLLAALDKIYPGVFVGKDVDSFWVGFRAMSKDRVPIAGAVPDVQYYEEHYADINHGKKNKVYLPARYLKGLYVSAAHGSRGFATSFICAELIASQIKGEPSPVSKAMLDYLSPSRFVVNDLKRR